MNLCNVHLRTGPGVEYTGEYMCLTCGALQNFSKETNVPWNTKLEHCQYPDQLPEAEPGHMADAKSWAEELLPEPTSREKMLSLSIEDYRVVTHAFASILQKMETEYNKDECCDYKVINRLIEES